jgi:hypothetical protein
MKVIWKNTKVRICLALVFIVAIAEVYSYFSKRAIDPFNPGFDINKFSFENYDKIYGDRNSPKCGSWGRMTNAQPPAYCSMPTEAEYFFRMFPSGTKKSYVDHVLVDIGKSKPPVLSGVQGRSKAYDYRYEYVAWGAPCFDNIKVIYDASDKVLFIDEADGGCVSL